jgi:hypothetical protein
MKNSSLWLGRVLGLVLLGAPVGCNHGAPPACETTQQRCQWNADTQAYDKNCVFDCAADAGASDH